MYFVVTPQAGHPTMASAIVRYPARGQAPEIYATRVKITPKDKCQLFLHFFKVS